jgi:hypothetical protein
VRCPWLLAKTKVVANFSERYKAAEKVTSQLVIPRMVQNQKVHLEDKINDKQVH